MQEFTAKHRDEIRGVLSGFDRLVFTERYLDALAEVDDDTTLGRAHPAPGTASAVERTQRPGSASLRGGSPLAGGGKPRGVHPERVP